MSPPLSHSIIHTLNLSGYKVVDVFQKDNWSMTFKAVQEGDGKAVHLKTTATSFPSHVERSRLQHEFEICKKIHSDSVIQCYEFHHSVHQPFIVFEDSGGIALDRLINGHMPLDQFLPLAIKICNALGTIHQHRIVHRNIKPGNVLYNPQTHLIKIDGFDLASFLSTERHAPTNPGLIEGTLPYISPEQTNRTSHLVDMRSDLYSLGVTLYEMLTGHLPFRAEGYLDWIHCHLTQPPPPPSELHPAIPQAVSMIILKLLEKIPELRYESAFGVKHDLEQCLHLLQMHRPITPFPLGLHDHSSDLSLPSRLYGRDNELKVLQTSLQNFLINTTPQFIAVSGPGGIGKTSLIRHALASLPSRNHCLLESVCDESSPDLPYALWLQAVKDLTIQLFTAGEEEFRRQGEALRQTLGPQGACAAGTPPRTRPSAAIAAGTS
jgi:serine/threonine protein kinase